MPRAASIVAGEGGCVVLRITRAVFDRLCGPITDILLRNQSEYIKYEAALANPNTYRVVWIHVFWKFYTHVMDIVIIRSTALVHERVIRCVLQYESWAISCFDWSSYHVELHHVSEFHLCALHVVVGASDFSERLCQRFERLFHTFGSNNSMITSMFIANAYQINIICISYCEVTGRWSSSTQSCLFHLTSSSDNLTSMWISESVFWWSNYSLSQVFVFDSFKPILCRNSKFQPINSIAIYFYMQVSCQ